MNVITSDGVRMRFEDFQTSRFLTDVSVETDVIDCDVPIPNVNSDTLSKIIFWLKNSDMELTEEWETLWRMAHAADYLDMPDMLDRTCKCLADQLRGKSPEQIRALLS